MMRPVIVVTGFEPFGPYAANPSADVAKALDGVEVAAAAVVRSAVLPVHHAGATARVERLLAEYRPAAIVHLGLAAGRARVALERVALNVMEYELPDALGYVAAGEPCVAAGPAAYFATLPLEAIRAALTADGIPAYLSSTAGTYLCNHTLYTTLHHVTTRELPTRVGFVHLPLSPAMVAAIGLEQPSMDTALMLRAVEIVLGVVAREAR